MKYLDLDIINEKNNFIYELIINEVIKLIDKYRIIIILIGIEIMFVYDKDINKIINKLINVIRWIMFNICKKDISKYYLE